jgi:hypothetical protein
VASGIDNGKWKVIPVSSKIGLDWRKSLFDGVEIRGIRGEEYQFAHSLVFNQGPNFFCVVDPAVVEDEYTSGPRVRVSEGDDKFPEELNETLRGDGARDDIMGDHAINSEDWENGVPLSTDKISVLNTTLSRERPAFLSSRGVTIASRFVNKHQHVRVSDNVSDPVHVSSSEYFIPFQCSYRDGLSGDVEPLECAWKCRDQDFAAPLFREGQPYLIQVDAVPLIHEGGNESDISGGERLRPTIFVGMWIMGKTIFTEILKSFVNKRLLDPYNSAYLIHSEVLIIV